jgi:hypothetical protein
VISVDRRQDKRAVRNAVCGKPFLNVGRDAEIRTRGLTHPKGARYQAAPRPVKAFLV